MPGPESDGRKFAFAPVVDQATRVLVLGSLPGDASLRAAQYYAHPQNAFWRLIGEVIGQADLHTRPYEARLAALKARGIGLWDVIANAERPGSLDTAIRQPITADLRGLVASLPRLQVVAFNGGRASRDGRRLLGDLADLTLIDLPSSSAAHTRPLSEKSDAWSLLQPHLPERLPPQA